ncbi:MAG: polysaccharide deacetylase family protein [Chloroflexota bacterium]
MKLVIGAGMLAGAILFAGFWTGAIGNTGDDPTSDGPGVIAVTNSPSNAATSATNAPTATESLPPGTPVTGPIDVPIMMYHIIGEPDRPENAGLTTSTEDFAAQMKYLACAGFHPVTVQRLFDAFDGKSSLPDKPIILTFDDGWVGQYTNGFPILRQHSFVGSFAIVTGYVSQGGPFVTWENIDEMSRAGMEFMSHTANHVDLGTTDDETDRTELHDSKAALESHLGHDVPYFVYPAGQPFVSGTAQRQAEVVQMLKDAGYRGALLDGSGYGHQDPNAPYELNRVRVSADESLGEYAGSIFGPDPASLNCG